MKQKIAVVFALILTLGLVACGNQSESVADTEHSDEVVTESSSLNDSTAQTDETDAAPQESELVDSEPDVTEQNILVAYFSNTGNTEEVAQRIAEDTGGDLAEIQRAEEYSDLYEEAKKEIDEGVYPEITVSADNVEDYDVIFVGYPIWWNEAPSMIGTFLEDYDFSGKTMIPFCTSSSSKIDNSLHIFSELCPDAEIAEGLTANNPDDIEPWLQSLGLME